MWKCSLQFPSGWTQGTTENPRTATEVRPWPFLMSQKFSSRSRTANMDPSNVGMAWHGMAWQGMAWLFGGLGGGGANADVTLAPPAN